MHQITIPENSSSNCFDSVIYSLLKYWKFDFELYNVKYFYTDYFSNISTSINRGKIYDDILKDIYNIDLIFVAREETYNLHDIVCDLLRSIPVGIGIDPYHCHWSPFYNKTHFSHLILIVGIDYLDKKYICFDVHFNEVGYVKVDFEIINKHFKYYTTFCLKETTNVKLDIIMNKIKYAVDNFDTDLSSKKTAMMNYLINTDRKSLFSEYIVTSPLLIELLWIYEDKRNFPTALRYIENKVKIKAFSSVYELLSASEKSFLLLKSVLIKYAMSGVLREEKLRDIVSHIYDTDALTIEKMRSALKEIE